MLNLPALLLALPISLIFPPAAHADMYIYADTHENANGAIRLSNVPVDAGYQILIAENEPAQESPSAALPPAPAARAMHKLPFDESVRAAASETSLEPALLHAVIAAESHHDAHAISPRGAQGLMQLMPATARRFHVSDPYDPAQNIRAGAHYLQELRDLYKGDMSLALAAYNAGPEAVRRYGGRIPPFAETRRYVPRVLQFYRELSRRLM